MQPRGVASQRFEHAAKVADAVLYEGYVLYPYRASALKNRFRWQFGSIAPWLHNERHPGEASWIQAQCLIAPESGTAITIRLRFLQLQRRTIEVPSETAADEWCPSERVRVDDQELIPWDEGTLHEITEGPLQISDLQVARTFEYERPANHDVAVMRDSAGVLRARVVREGQALRFAMRVVSQPSDGLERLSVRIENRMALEPNASVTDDSLRSSLVSCHALLGVDNGAFISLLDPPPSAAAAARACEHKVLWPVLIGEPGARDVMLAAPIVLYDYPAVAAASSGDFFDATEIDELLTLRVLTLTDAEKAEAAQTDERAKEIVARVEQLAPNEVMRLHAVVRPAQPPKRNDSDDAWNSLLAPAGEPAPDDAWVFVGTTRVQRGSRVRLAPQRRADSMDTFLAGRAATVAAVHRDLESREYVAVTLDDDPAADLQRAVGRYFYFGPEEIEPMAPDTLSRP